MAGTLRPVESARGSREVIAVFQSLEEGSKPQVATFPSLERDLWGIMTFGICFVSCSWGGVYCVYRHRRDTW